MRVTLSSQLVLLVATMASLLLAASAVSIDEERAASDPAAPAILRRQRRNPLLIPVGVAVARVAGRYVVTIGRQVQKFRSEKAALEFLRQPSTLRRINKLPESHGNIVNVPSRKIAKETAKRLNDVKKMKPVHDRNPKKGNPHYHPVDKMGNRKPQHIAYPKTAVKTRTKYSSGAKQKAAKVAQQAAGKSRSSSNVGKSSARGNGGGSNRNGGSKRGGSGGGKRG